MLALGLLAWGACTTAYMVAEVVSITLDLHAIQKFHCAFNSNVYGKGSAGGKRNDTSWDSGRAALDGVLAGTTAANENASVMSAIVVARKRDSKTSNMYMIIDTTDDTDSFCSNKGDAMRCAKEIHSLTKVNGSAMRSARANHDAPLSAASTDSIANEESANERGEKLRHRHLCAVERRGERITVQWQRNETRKRVEHR